MTTLNYKDLSAALGDVLDRAVPQPLVNGGWSRPNGVDRSWLKDAINLLADVLSDDPAFDRDTFLANCGVGYAKS